MTGFKQRFDVPAGTDDLVVKFLHRTGDQAGLSGMAFDTATIIPEPSTLLVWGLGLLGLAWYARRRRAK